MKIEEANRVGLQDVTTVAAEPAVAVRRKLAADEPRVDLTRLPVFGPILARGLRSRKFQFSIILPSQILFWIVIVVGIVGTLEPTKNFATAITWYWWFALMFPLTLLIGRAWCVTCPFGGLAEWIQRKTLWGKTKKSLGLGWKMPRAVANRGLFVSAFLFIGMTWAEEFFNIGGPGDPIMTSMMVVGIVSFAVISFLVLERREFCRYLCPLSAVLGVCGTNAAIAGFRPKSQEVCQKCKTKNCLRGSEKAYGCPWGTYPATANTNVDCGLCSECYKSCPNDNISVYAQKPFSSLIHARKKQTYIAWVAAMLFGLVIFQQWNALGSYSAVDNWLNSVTRFPGYPNPIDFIISIAAVAGLLAGFAFLLSRTLSIKTKAASAFSSWFAPIMYGIIPLFGADFLSRVMPKFFNNAPKVIGIIGNTFGGHLNLADVTILPNSWLVRLQIIVVAVGTVGAVYATSKIMRKDVNELAAHKTLSRIIPAVVIVLVGAGLCVLYFAMNGAE